MDLALRGRAAVRTAPEPFSASVRANPCDVDGSVNRQHLGIRHLNRRVKALLGVVIYQTMLYRALWKDRAVIVVFHRIDDRFPADPLTCSVHRFRAYCDFFQRYFVVVSLRELLAKLRAGQDISRHLVITFDDGYRDNHRVASVELKRRSLPACFFITTGYMGSTANAWWDTYRDVTSEWMSWDDVRSLHAQGFELGLHTVNHVDLGIVNGAQAEEEIVGAKRRLEAELRAEAEHFCYPFGRARQLSDANRVLVRAAGYRSCLSAYGGTVRAGDDAYHLKRTALDDWFTSPYQFGFEVAWRGT